MKPPPKGVTPILGALTDLRRARDEEQVLATGLQAVETLLGTSDAVIHIEAEDGGRLIWRNPEDGKLLSQEGSPSSDHVLVRCRGADEAAFEEQISEPIGPLSGAVLAVPLSYEGEELGSIGVRASGEDGDTLLELGRHLAFAILDARERRRFNRQSTQLQSILQSTLVLNSTLDLDRLLELLMDIAVDLSGAEAGALFLKREGRGDLYFKVARGDSEEELVAKALEPGEGIAGWVSEHGQTVCVEDAQRDRRFSPKIDEALGLETRSLICVPLKTQDEVIGALEVIRHKNQAPFDETSVVLLSSLANQAAIAVKNAMLYQLAITDELTGLYSYRYFQDAMNRETKLAEKNRSVLSLLLLDVDRFKTFNDEHGHKVGDLVLQEISEVLRKSLRDTDVVARYGGEEMAVILRDTPKETAVVIAERIRKSIEELDVQDAEGQNHHVTVSIGVSAYPVDTPVRERLFYLVDSALYAAKEGGRNKVVAFGPEIMADNIALE